MIKTLALRLRFGKKSGLSYNFEGRLLQLLANFIQIMFTFLKLLMFAFTNPSVNTTH